VFEVSMERATAELDVGGGNRVELALDRGEVRRGRKRAPVCELEIESIAGDPLAVFDAAERFLGRVPMRASATSKAQRGYALTRKKSSDAPVKVQPVVARPDDSIDTVARHVVSAALAQLHGNEARAGLLGGDDYVHQFRIGLRRLRSVLRVFRLSFPPQQLEDIRADCRWLAQLTGEARDWDVFTMKMLPALAQGGNARTYDRMAAQAERQREAARERLRAGLDSPRYTRFVLRFARWMAESGDGKGDARAHAAVTLKRQHRKASKALRGIDAMDATQRHQVRIRLKKLRYACDALAPLFAGDATSYLAALKDLQDALGDAADARTAMRHLDALRAPEAARRAGHARLTDIERQSLQHIDHHAAALREAPRFWKGE
jgi:CHAD domain-containing protein